MNRILVFALLLTRFHEVIGIPQRNDDFPVPKHSNSRTAIIISGDLRTGNMSFLSDVYISDSKESAASMHRPNSPDTPIQSFLEYFVKPIAMYGGVDMFIYLPVARGTNETASRMWNGDKEKYQPIAGDTRACQLYADRAIFSKHTGNRIFCLAEYEEIHLNMFVQKQKLMNRYAGKPIVNKTFSQWQNHKEIFLQQEYGKYRGNVAAKQYALMTGITYKYKIRSRHDQAALKSLPPIDTMQFTGNSSYYCNNNSPRAVIFHPTVESNGLSGVDSFNFGRAEDMDFVLDRYVELLTKPAPLFTAAWYSEQHLRDSAWYRGNVCLAPHEDIEMNKIRWRGYAERTMTNSDSPLDWVIMPPALSDQS